MENPFVAGNISGIFVAKIGDVAYTVPEENHFISRLGLKRYELVNHLGNVQAVITDRALPVRVSPQIPAVSHYTADLLSATDYYPFGMVMAGRSLNTDDYRYGFNGKEFDQDWDGGEAMYDFGARIYDPRTNRWGSVDPLSQKVPGVSPYVAMDNSPLAKIDPDGRLPVFLIPFIPMIVGGIAGALTDVSAQIIVGMTTQNKDFTTSVKDVNLVSTGLSTLSGATIASTGGAGTPLVTALTVVGTTETMRSSISASPFSSDPKLAQTTVKTPDLVEVTTNTMFGMIGSWGAPKGGEKLKETMNLAADSDIKLVKELSRNGQIKKRVANSTIKEVDQLRKTFNTGADFGANYAKPTVANVATGTITPNVVNTFSHKYGRPDRNFNMIEIPAVRDNTAVTVNKR